MTTQTKALRLADLLTTDAYWSPMLGEQAAAELRRLAMVEFAFDQWNEKTEWVQDTAQPGELGMHRADVLKQRIDRLHEVNQELLEALKGSSNYIDKLGGVSGKYRQLIAKATGKQA